MSHYQSAYDKAEFEYQSQATTHDRLASKKPIATYGSRPTMSSKFRVLHCRVILILNHAPSPKAETNTDLENPGVERNKRKTDTNFYGTKASDEYEKAGIDIDKRRTQEFNALTYAPYPSTFTPAASC
jgi:hypothetical protein